MDLTDLTYEDNNQKLYFDIQEICYSEPAEPVGLEPVAKRSWKNANENPVNSIKNE